MQLTFKTTSDGENTYCCARDDGTKLRHRFADKRNGHGHDPGYVYLVYLPTGKQKGCHHIGKVEYTRIGSDDFDLDEIDPDLLRELKRRMDSYHPAKTETDQKYNGAQFVHGIRVACGEGAEKQPHHFFKSKRKAGGEIFDLTEADIALFKKATGSVLGRKIKHLKAEIFANYLANQAIPENKIRKLVLLPDHTKIGAGKIRRYLRTKNNGTPFPSETPRYQVKTIGAPSTKTKPALANTVLRGNWYEVNGMQGVELPTFFLRCIKSLKTHGSACVRLRKDVDPEDKILRFKHHWRFQDYTAKFQMTPDEWETIFDAVRSAESIE